jgi:putative intracellular protease/amidase
VVVPALPDDGEPSTAPVTEWLRTQAAGGAQLLSVCNGAGVLALRGTARRAAGHTPGVGEIELASVFDIYGGQSLAGRTLALSGDRGPVRSRHGLTFLPRAGLATGAAGIDRLLVPGTAAATAHAVAPPDGPVPQYLHDRPGFAYDIAIEDIAQSMDVATACWTARALELPTDGLVLEGRAWPWLPTALPFVLALLGAGAVAGVSGLARRGRGGRRSTRPGGSRTATGADLTQPGGCNSLDSNRLVATWR